MKVKFMLIYWLVNQSLINAQQFAIENKRLNYAYPQIENNLRVIVENEKCENIFIRTNNGKIFKEDSLRNDCQYIFIPDTIGIANLTVFKINKQDTIKIGENKYRIKKWPEHRAKIGNVESGIMSRGEFLAHGRIIVPIQMGDICGKLKINSYKIEVLRNNKRLLNLLNFGDAFDKINFDKLIDIKDGDVIYISEVKLIMPGEFNQSKLNDIRIEIKNGP